MYQLTKTLRLIKPEFDQLNLKIFGGFAETERCLYDLNNLFHRMKYFLGDKPGDERTKYFIVDRRAIHKPTFDKLTKELNEANQRLKSTWGKFLYEFLTKHLAGGCDPALITDVFMLDVDVDAKEIDIKFLMLSHDLQYVNHVDQEIPEDKPYRVWPNKFYRYHVSSYNESIESLYPELFKGPGVNTRSHDDAVYVHNFTFQSSDDCNLSCTYCYQHNKGCTRLDFKTAKKVIDNLLTDQYGYINQHNSPAIILDFVGGDPLLEIHVTRKIYEYFLAEAWHLKHPWFDHHRLSVCSNGLLYFSDDVQQFFKDYYDRISFNISIDGNKQLHDSCRIQPNGEGSYDIDIAALAHYNKHYSSEKSSKMTLAPENMKYLFDSVVNFINCGMYAINLNCVFENVWNIETAKLEFQQLKKLADYIIDNGLENIYISIFDERPEERSDKGFDGNFCGGTGSMLGISPDGTFYPCLRYMPSSLGENIVAPALGTVESGMIGRKEGSEVLEVLDRVRRRSQSNDICYDCPIGSSCAWCSAYCAETYGTANKRSMFICLQACAETLANVYYWNKLALKHPEYDLPVRKNNVPDEWALKILEDGELIELGDLELMVACERLMRH